MPHDGIVIVGSGHAGARAAQSLRANGWQHRISVIDGEGCAPYERPPLSKAVLSGKSRPEDAVLFPQDFVEQHGIDFRSGVRAVGIDRDTRQVRLSNDDAVSYGRLLLTPGAEPRLLDIPGRELEGVFSLRTAVDACGLSGQLLPGADVVIVGGGLIGLEVAASAIQRGCSVTVIEAGPRLMTRAVPPELAELIRLLHETRGVRFILGRQAVALLGSQRIEALRMDDGSTLACTAALISIGVTPRTDLALAAGLEIENGIAVDCFLKTSDPFIYAAGDACAFKNGDGSRLRLECWKNAEDQGALAARNMMGANEPYTPMPWMWSDQYDRTMQIAGHPEFGEQHVARHCPDGSLLVYHLDANDAIVGVSGFGSLREIARGVRTGQMLMQRGIHPAKEALQNPKIDLKAAAKVAAG
ncbi:NAD(P)/FAD-dependent oxidoreductase [Sinorhizobium medicae]|uniref:NAD(P)/FAD-dependent oxidoreductase n=1 Tax=Sinorhizobium medicae TaxID=110321 RepID=UPI00130C22EB|nr:ferredoxin reductase [Sinorhizobium medicae]